MNASTLPAASGDVLAGDSLLMTVSGALALIVLTMVALAWLARRSGIAGRLNDGKGAINLVASKSLGNRERVVVVDVQGCRLVLGVTAGQISCLATLEAHEPSPQTHDAKPCLDFSSVLTALRQKYRKD